MHREPPADRALLDEAEEHLTRACAGWRRNRRCIDDAGRREMNPHPACLQAQYHHDVLLLEHGLLGGR